nr:glycerophosphodiester phosphodiesterase family protein [Leuconostoc lactis]
MLLANQLGVNVWTVNDAETAKRLADWGAHAIFTDFPKTM